ncbi:hypothetical protein [Brachybacterium sacelli]|uniref:Uncharacterized protein n=1 Tax=Brachybacterium sacelli TaxID=173364 RepID=A0ABS4WWF8_9MICO|nr:hypothetical protein [Brachybacterium sacelli]MBP2380541.1 hypothetical protein [Brachybacterium sacelli]
MAETWRFTPSGAVLPIEAVVVDLDDTGTNRGRVEGLETLVPLVLSAGSGS